MLINGCSSEGPKSNYNYISNQDQRVLELCYLVFTDPYYQYISPSRRVRLKKIKPTPWGLWATFDDGRKYRVPIKSGLNIGKNYYCSFQNDSKYCPSLNNSNYKCEWNKK